MTLKFLIALFSHGFFFKIHTVPVNVFAEKKILNSVLRFSWPFSEDGVAQLSWKWLPSPYDGPAENAVMKHG